MNKCKITIAIIFVTFLIFGCGEKKATTVETSIETSQEQEAQPEISPPIPQEPHEDDSVIPKQQQAQQEASMPNLTFQITESDLNISEEIDEEFIEEDLPTPSS